MDDRSERNLMGVHADLVKVVRKTMSDWASVNANSRLTVTEGVRSKARQAELYKAGASMTLESRHLTGHAVDLALLIDGKADWSWPPFVRIGTLMKSNAGILGVPIIWGGDWRMRDGPHFELDRAYYP